MALFDTLSNTTDENATATLHALLKGLRAKVTQATVREALEQHPDFPSLLSLSDVLTDWQVENTALQLNTTEQLRELPFPFVAHLRKNNGWYVLVMALQGETITYIDSAEGESTRGRKTESLPDFERKWSGIVLLAETDEKSGEKEYATHRRQEVLNELRGPFVLAGALLIFLVALLCIAQDLKATDWLLLLTKAVGLTLSGLLVANQLGSKNALTDRLCRINSKTNCDGVLNSPAAKLWGWLSWTDVGLLYFSGGLLTVLLVGIQPNVRPLLYGLSLVAMPYTVFSVYYQARVLRQWCPLCLGVQGVLLVEGVLAATQLTGLPGFVQPYLLILITFLLPTLVWVTVKPLLAHRSKSRDEHEELMQFKRNPDLFHALLMQQPQMPPIPNNLHPIVLGNPEAKHTITMVTNPYCGPCGKTHKELEAFLKQNQNVKAEIIFLACDGTNGDVHKVARHLLVLHKEQPQDDHLSDWYENELKEFDSWALTKPVNYISTEFDALVEQHCTWCQSAKVDRTPMLFINGFLLPDIYPLTHLRWLINYLPATDSLMDLAKST